MTPHSGPPLLYFLIVVLAIILVVLLLLYTLHKARKPVSAEPGAPSSADAALNALARALSSKGVPASFSRALTFLREQVAGRDYRYDVPWLLMMGPEGSGKSTVLANASPSDSLIAHGGRTFGIPGGPEWWFYQRGLVINAPGNLVRRADGHTSDHAAWSALLRLLVARRPRRPLDGVVLAISITDLLNDAILDDSASGPDLTARAEVLCQKLSQLRQAVRMRLPIYVLVTQCDRIPGFSSFASELPKDLHTDIFGWSNPYPLEAAFSSGWVEECVREMHNRIVEQQMEIFVQRDHLHDPDGVFLFPARFAAIAAPLRQYLAFIFQSTAYQESFYFRGIYFSGDASIGSDQTISQPLPARALAAAAGEAGTSQSLVPDLQPAAASPQSLTPAPEFRAVTTRPPRPVFVHDLFERKIFPESVLARPFSVLNTTRNRTVLIAQALTAIFVLVFGIGATVDYYRFSSLKRDYLSGIFNQLQSYVARGDDQTTRDVANDVLQSIGFLSQHPLRSVFLPWSWDGHVDHDLQLGLGRAFGTSVLPVFRADLTGRLATLIAQTDARSAASDAPTATAVYENILSVPEYQDWSQFISGIQELEQNIGRYNRLATVNGGSSDDLTQLLKYLQAGVTLPADFDARNPYFQQIIDEASSPPIPPDPQANAKAAEHARDLIDRFFSTWFGAGNRLGYDVDQMLAAIDRLSIFNSSTGYQTLKDISDSIARVSGDLDSSDFAWLSDEDFDLQQYPAFANPIENFPNGPHYLDAVSLEKEIEVRGKTGFLAFRTNLARKSTRLTGLVLDMDSVASPAQNSNVRDPHNDLAPVQLSGSVAALQSNLRILLNQVFVAREPGPGRPQNLLAFSWDRNTLLEASKLADAYDQYSRGSLHTAPPTIADALRRAAAERLQDNLLDYIAEAQIAPLPSGASEAAGFNQSIDVLQRLVTASANFPDRAAARNFTAILTAQASRILTALETDLDSRSLYAVRDQNFDWWEGEKPLSLAAYDVRGADDLKDYLDREREQVSSLAQQAAPALQFLQSQTASLTPAFRQGTLNDWRGISQELKKYADKTPGNSVLLLEDFVRSGMDKIAPDASCADTTRNPAGRSDYFLARRDDLRMSLLARCRALAQDDYTAQIAAIFNQRLSGRFPFSSASPQQPYREADPAALVDFFAKYDQYAKNAKTNLTAKAGSAPALAFLAQLDPIRQVFAPFLMSAEKNPVPSFDLAVTFRANQNEEIAGNQISGWSLDVGAQSLAYRSKANTAQWRLGDPVRLTLRFADDSPALPQPDPKQRAMAVQKRLVTFEYTEPWSLFRLLLDHENTP
ncbi:MAG TPA: type VI secretion system protein, partial [Bryobacteraceae bacterium]|nr:type VI secretion system protein [Bryobacteraceae bacterium]